MGAMTECCRPVVTALLTPGSAAARFRTRRPRERLAQGLRLLVRQGRLGPALTDGLRVHARAGARVEAVEHEAVTRRVDDGERKALVATGVVEGVVADESDSTERAPDVALERRGPGRDVVEVAGDASDPVEMLAEHGLEAALVAAAGQRLQAAAEPRDPAREDADDDEQDDDGDRQDAAQEPGVGRDERLQIDRTGPPAIGPSLAGGLRPGRRVGGPAGARWYPSPPMAKRTRYDSRATGRRPAANRLVRRDPPKAKPAVVPLQDTVVLEPVVTEFDAETGAPSTVTGRGLSQAEIDRAAQLEARLTSQERALQAATRARAAAAPGLHTATGHAPVDVNAPLAVRASKEYAYVARDIRRIALTGGLMVAILAVIAFLVDVLGVLKI